MPQAIVDGVLSFDAFVSITLAILLLFAGKGLAARIGTLGRYGIPEPVLGGVLCAAVVCALYYGAGLMVGSISLTGGVGTTLAWAPTSPTSSASQKPPSSAWHRTWWD
ncbi:sodium/glutamate symporter [Luteimonas sp. A534]